VSFRPRLIGTTERLDVRPLGDRHFAAWAEANNARLPKQNPFDTEKRPPEAVNRRVFGKIVREHEALRRADRYYNFAFTERSDGRLVGMANVRVVARMNSQLGWLGYSLYNHEWGRGYAREGVAEVIRLTFHELRLYRLEAGIRPENRASKRLARSLGLKRAFKAPLFQDGAWIDIHVYATTADEWGVTDLRPTVGLNRI
jgi:ribosomal-protein-alanine N-acetyltransferase